MIECPHCFGKARIGSSNKISINLKDLYCQCLNVQDCGATFVLTLSFKNDLNPPVKNTQQLAAHLIRHLPKDQRAALLQEDLFH